VDRIGRYEVLGEIARGGMGAVFRAVDPARGQEVALKVLLSAGERPRRRLQREAEAVARLEHPRIVPIIDWGSERGNPFVVMELIPGESLAERLRTQGRLRPRAAAELVAHLADAVEHAHQAGILHRDLKPANVLLDPTRGPLLTDFGLARELDASRSRLTQTGAALGTPGYWSPEQAVGALDTLTPATDVYGLGAVLHACLTGRPPLEGDSLHDAIYAAARRRASPTGADPRLDRILLRSLRKEPAERYAHAGDLAAALRAYLAGEDPEPAPSRFGVGALALGLTLLAGALLVAVLVLGARQTDPGEAAGSRPSAEPSLGTQGVRLFRKGRFAEALRTLTQAAEEEPGNPEHRYGQGMCHLRMDDLPAALAAFERALEVDPKHEKSRMGQAELLNRMERFDEALPLFREVAADHPAKAQAFIGQGAALFGLEQYLESEAAYDRAVALDPQHPQAWGGRGATRLELGRHTDAEADFSRALALTPDDPGWHESRAAARLALEDYAGAADDLTKFIALHGDSAGVRLLRGNARFKQAPPDLAGALRDYERALELLPADHPQRASLEASVRILRSRLGD
jgi:tetratricopeptide (TPR) repeat protein/predicted Ser/Thr protein kinase